MEVPFKLGMIGKDHIEIAQGDEGVEMISCHFKCVKKRTRPTP